MSAPIRHAAHAILLKLGLREALDVSRRVDATPIYVPRAAERLVAAFMRARALKRAGHISPPHAVRHDPTRPCELGDSGPRGSNGRRRVGFERHWTESRVDLQFPSEHRPARAIMPVAPASMTAKSISSL